MVAIQHIGCAWVPAGMRLLAWSILGTEIPRTAAVHALTAGAMASMILAVMTRATLGHTGRELESGAATLAIFVFVWIGPLLPVIAGLRFVVLVWG